MTMKVNGKEIKWEDAPKARAAPQGFVRLLATERISHKS
jgi:hypothetical protein